MTYHASAYTSKRGRHYQVSGMDAMEAAAIIRGEPGAFSALMDAFEDVAAEILAAAERDEALIASGRALHGDPNCPHTAGVYRERYCKRCGEDLLVAAQAVGEDGAA